uniref:Uncharacterized protein n=1 Tax=Romanomermis culicivorax TaxID=13658 RepID=A0A915JJ85_ROMCU
MNRLQLAMREIGGHFAGSNLIASANSCLLSTTNSGMESRRSRNLSIASLNFPPLRVAHTVCSGSEITLVGMAGTGRYQILCCRHRYRRMRGRFERTSSNVIGRQTGLIDPILSWVRTATGRHVANQTVVASAGAFSDADVQQIGRQF